MKFLGIIPARYASTRFPAKPLALLGGKPVIQHVYERASQAMDVVVATDNQEIFSAVEAFGGRVVMTSDKHRTGTDRCYEAYRNIHSDADVVVNIQGDEPFVDPRQLRLLMDCFDLPATDIATLVIPFPADTPYEVIADPNKPKCIKAPDGRAVYFSRHPVPYLRGREKDEWARHHTYYRHIGVYAYRSSVLGQITGMRQTPLEIAESLEQLRWLENGLTIQTAETDIETIGIDTPEDLRQAEEYLNSL